MKLEYLGHIMRSDETSGRREEDPEEEGYHGSRT
jgi:hypothetical protein